MSDNVGIVIVSHSRRRGARHGRHGAADGRAARCRSAWCGGDPGGGLGTSVEAIMAAIERAWSDKGVAILVDLGGAETNSEMAIEMLPKRTARPRRRLQCADRRGRRHGGDGSVGRRHARRGAPHSRGIDAGVMPGTRSCNTLESRC